MTEVTAISAQAVGLLVHYSFDLDSDTAEQLVALWLTHYPPHWLRLAVIEALYQGRYKAVSVEHILDMWQRRGQPLYHFNHDFERLVCSNFFQDLMEEAEALSSPETTILPELEVALSATMPEALPGLNSQLYGVIAAENSHLEAVAAPVTHPEEETLPSPDFPPIPVVKHTDFHSKLKSVAQRGNQKPNPEIKPQTSRRRRSRMKDDKN